MLKRGSDGALPFDVSVSTLSPGSCVRARPPGSARRRGTGPMCQALTRHSAVVWLLASVVISPTIQAEERGPSRTPLPDERLGIRTAPLLLLEPSRRLY